jgi:hypothetical protein
MSVYIWHQGETGRKELNLQARRVRDRGTGYSAESSKVRFLQRRRVRRSRKGKFKPPKSEAGEDGSPIDDRRGLQRSGCRPSPHSLRESVAGGTQPGVLTRERASLGAHHLFH